MWEKWKVKNVDRASNYLITGPGQHKTSNTLEALQNDNFTVSLNKFLLIFGKIITLLELITKKVRCYWRVVKVALYSNNTLPYTNVNRLYAIVGRSACKTIPVYHAFTGLNYIAAFSRKRKSSPT